MAVKTTFTVSAAVAAYVRPGTAAATRLAGCAAADELLSVDRLTLLFCLSKDTDPSIRSAAVARIAAVPEEIVSEYRDSAAADSRILECLHRFRKSPAGVMAAPVAVSVSQDPVSDALIDALSEAPDVSVSDDGDEADDEMDAESDQTVQEDGEEYLSKFRVAQMMGISEKIKMALSGDKEWRAILVKDSNKLISTSVIRNPRISDGEVMGLIKAGIQNDEIMRLICANKEWTKNYQMRKALIESSRTPVQNAIRYLGTMSEKDLGQFAKSKNISSVLSTLAKRLLLNKKR